MTDSEQTPSDNDRAISELNPYQLAIFRVLNRALHCGVPPLALVEGVLTFSRPNKLSAFGVVMEAINCSEAPFIDGILDQLQDLCTVNGEVDVDRANFILAVIKDAEPDGSLESMAAFHMATLHLAFIRAERRLAHATDPKVHEAGERSLARLSKAYVRQLDSRTRRRVTTMKAASKR